MEADFQENMSEINQNEKGFKHGQFKVTLKTLENKSYDYVINPLSQDELADGWRLVLPKRGRKSTVHHFSIYLSQLPPYLWKFLQTSWTDNVEYYDTINDGIYQYTVKMSKHDEDIRKLYKLVMNQCPDKEKIAPLYDHLEKQRVKGWLMICASNILNA